MTVLGIDVSAYQAGIDMRRVVAEGHDFTIIKITEGVGYRNPAWPAQRDAARSAGLLIAGYHYMRGSSPTAEATACRAWIGDPTIPIMLDWEDGGGTYANLVATVAAFRQAGLRPLLGYLPRWYWERQGCPDLRGLGLVLVSSRYPTAAVGTPRAIYQAGVTANTWAGYGGLTPAILQFTDRASVAGLRTDANAYPGSREQLAALLGSAAVSAVSTSKDEPSMDVDLHFASDGGFRGITNVEAGSSSAVVSAAWVAFNIAFGVPGQPAADVRITFRDTTGHVMGEVNDHILTGLPNDFRTAFAAPDGCGSVTVEGHAYGGAIPSVSVVYKAR